MGREALAAKMAEARAREPMVKRARKVGATFRALLAQLPPAVARSVVGDHRAQLAEMELVGLDPSLLARLGAGWAAAVEDLAVVDPGAAESLRSRMGAYLDTAPKAGAA